MEAADANPAPAAADDRALMERVQSDDEQAFAALMAHWEVPTKSLIARLVFNTHEAEELAQETFVRVWQQRGKYRPGAEFKPWLFAIAVNLARNRLRWWKRRPTVSMEEWTPTGEGEVAGGTQLTSASPVEGAVGMERAERAAAVRDAISALPAELREAIVLFEYEQLSQAEIAAAVGTTPKAVETRIYRAREKLRRALAGLRSA